MECVVLVVWLVCGAIGAVICEEKGRSALGGLLLGLLFGPLGVIVCAVMSTNQQALERMALSSGRMRKCRFCAEPVRVEATVCRHCGREIPLAQISAVLYTDDGMLLHTCRNCGVKHDLTRLDTCPGCGWKDPSRHTILKAHTSETARAEAGLIDTEELLTRGIAAAKAGRRSDARHLLGRAVQQDSCSERAWLWLSGVADNDKERMRCLRQVLSINPDNRDAERGLELLEQRRKASRRRWTVIAVLVVAVVIVAVVGVLLAYSLGAPSAAPSTSPHPTEEPTAAPASPSDSDYSYWACREGIQDDLSGLHDEMVATFRQAREVPDSASLCRERTAWANAVTSLVATHADCSVPTDQRLQAIRENTNRCLAETVEAVGCWRAHCDSSNEQWRWDWLEEAQTHSEQAGIYFATVVAEWEQCEEDFR
jgi:hypothetical protein